jgi:hypothetical protein
VRAPWLGAGWLTVRQRALVVGPVLRSRFEVSLGVGQRQGAVVLRDVALSLKRQLGQEPEWARARQLGQALALVLALGWQRRGLVRPVERRVSIVLWQPLTERSPGLRAYFRRSGIGALVLRVLAWRAAQQQVRTRFWEPQFVASVSVQQHLALAKVQVGVLMLVGAHRPLAPLA